MKQNIRKTGIVLAAIFVLTIGTVPTRAQGSRPQLSDGLCQVEKASGTIDGWNQFIEGIAFHLKSTVTPSGYTLGSP
ncbi:MAG: hypothetical protein O7E51_14295 [Acidobacteria bacterium]|nr:hypothetical protein [Acidobacteriota bacterium]